MVYRVLGWRVGISGISWENRRTKTRRRREVFSGSNSVSVTGRTENTIWSERKRSRRQPGDVRQATVCAARDSRSDTWHGPIHGGLKRKLLRAAATAVAAAEAIWFRCEKKPCLSPRRAASHRTRQRRLWCGGDDGKTSAERRRRWLYKTDINACK